MLKLILAALALGVAVSTPETRETGRSAVKPVALYCAIATAVFWLAVILL